MSEKIPFLWQSMCKRCRTVFDRRKSYHCPNCGHALPIVGAAWIFGFVFLGISIWKIGEILRLW